MIQDMHRSENWAYPLYFLCSSPILPSFKHTWHCTADNVVTPTQQHFVTHDTVRFLANMILSGFCKHDTAFHVFLNMILPDFVSFTERGCRLKKHA